MRDDEDDMQVTACRRDQYGTLISVTITYPYRAYRPDERFGEIAQQAVEFAFAAYKDAVDRYLAAGRIAPDDPGAPSRRQA